ncbi:hypothetical protein PENTCL1PPCAC_8303, partial [Pristionchus entomophagus]
VSSPCLIDAGCGDCAELEKELEWERKSDTACHSCRSCNAPTLSAEACPKYGYHCEEKYAITVNKLSTLNGNCLKARCLGTAKLAVEGTLIYQIHCNNSKWMAGDKEATSVISAKDCNPGSCKASAPKVTGDFVALTVTPATLTTANKCAIGTCANGLVAVTADGALDEQLTGVEEVTCSGEGKWTYGGGEEKQYVMCNKQAVGCQPMITKATETQCQAWVALGSSTYLCDMTNVPDVQPTTITCAGVLTGLVFQSGDKDASFGFNQLTCKDGAWFDEAMTKITLTGNALVYCVQ